MSESKNFLTPEECAEQFRNYAKCLDGNELQKERKFALEFCAEFLDKFCIQVKK